VKLKEQTPEQQRHSLIAGIVRKINHAQSAISQLSNGQSTGFKDSAKTMLREALADLEEHDETL